MQDQDRAIPPTGGEGTTSQGSTEIKSLIDSIATMKGVMGDLVTRVSAIDRRTQESQELERIMRSMNTDSETNNEAVRTQPSQQQQTGKSIEDMSKAELVDYLTKSLGQQFNQTVSSLDKRISDLGTTMQVKQLAASDPDWNKKIRPVAFELSKKPGFDKLGVEQLDQVARGQLALREVETLQKQIEEQSQKLEDLERSAIGDKPGFFVGVEEPPKPMDDDESFNDALEKSGLTKLPR